MDAPDDRRYTKAHEWVLDIGDHRVRIGITDYAQDALGDVVYVDLPDTGKTVQAGETLAEVESTKSVGEIYAPVSGTVTGANTALDEQPELVNSDPYADGWIVEMQLSGDGAEDLLDASAYIAFTEAD